MQDWPLLKNTSFIRQRSDHNWFFEKYWRSQFDLVFQNKIDTWDYQWSFTCWKENWWGILPKTNLTTNIGFDMNATHTKGEVPAYITKAGQQDLIFPLQHPPTLIRNVQADKLLDKIAFNLSLKSKLSQKYHNLLNKWRFK